jgi:HK97 family phage prohead protease
MANNFEKRSKNKVEKISTPIKEIRSINEDGTFEGYIAVWNSVDSYKSKFQRGSFKKTIQERNNKIKVFYDHEHLIGSCLEIREDEYGVYAKGSLNLAVEKAKEAYEFMKDGTIDGLSFGFRTIKEKFEDGVRVITELALYEFGPVVFPANEMALITSIRSTNFDETLSERELSKKGYTIYEALNETITDIWYSRDTTSENVIPRLDVALGKFHGAYLEFAQKWIEKFWINDNGDQIRSCPFSNELSNAVRSLNMSVDEICQNTSLTLSEITNLRRGEIINERRKLDELPEELKKIHQHVRSEKLEKLCSELRDGLTDSEKQRISALLNFNQPEPEQESADNSQVRSLVESIAEFRKHFNTGE